MGETDWKGNWVLFWWTGPWSVQFCSVTQSWPTLVIHGPQHTRLPCPSLIPRGCLNSCPSSWWCHPTISSLSSLSPPAFNLSQHQGISNESGRHIRWPNFWSFSISPSNEYPGLISFKIDWFDHFVVWGLLTRLLQHHSSKASILQQSACFVVQLAHPHMTTGKAIVLIRLTFVGNIMSLLFSMLSGLVITFLPRSKCLLISEDCSMV